MASFPQPGQSIQLQIPVPIKRFLVEDFERIHKEDKYLPLPREVNIEQFLQQFTTKHKKEFPPEAARTFTNGMIDYFNKSFELMLLYDAERKRTLDLLATFPNRTPSSLFGPEHLSRLFVRLPDILPTKDLSSDDIATLQYALSLLLKFMDSMRAKMFAKPEDYRMDEKARAMKEKEKKKRVAENDEDDME